MRDYGKISPKFWTSETGRAIRAAGGDAQRVALYLLTCPMSSMIGMYYLPMPVLCHEVGITLQGASKALRSLSEAQFAYYDAPSEHVWVPEMAAHQIGGPLTANDKRCKGIVKEWLALSKCRFHKDFHDRYGSWFHLPPISPFEGPCKPLRSQEQEQEQEQEQNQEQEQEQKQEGSFSVADVQFPPSIDCKASRDAISEWLVYKRSKGQAYKDPSHIQKKLLEFETSAALVEAVNHSIGSNYAGLFSPGGSSAKSKSKPGPGQRHDPNAEFGAGFNLANPG